MPFEPPESFNIADYFLNARVAEGRGDRVALRLDDGELTYREVQRLAARFGNVMRGMGLEPEERVLLALPDGAEYVGALFGTLQLGAVVVMVNPGLPAQEVGRLCAFTRARLAVVGGEALPAYEAALRADGNRLRGLLVVGGEGGGHTSWEVAGAAASDALETVPTHRDDPAIWLFSGGTTGRPKAVLQTHRSYANTTELYAKGAIGYGEDDVTIAVPRLYFGYATGANLFFPFAVGGSAVLFAEPPTPAALFSRIRRHGATILVNVPTMVQRMVDDPAASEQDLSSLRLAISAGEALPVPLWERWRDTFGVELLDGLGTAEMWHIFLSNLPGRARPGTLGRAVPGFEVRVCDDEGRELPRGEVGRLWVRGDSRGLGYWQNLPETKETFRGEWVALADLVQMDAAGWVTYCGRSDDVLKVGGKWCAPAEVEGVLLAHEAVRECAVVGAANADGLVKPCAFVVVEAAREGLEEELRQFVLARLDAYKHPRRVVVLPELPRTHLGKVDRGALRRLAEGR